MFLKSLFLFIKLVYYSVLSKIRNSIESLHEKPRKKNRLNGSSPEFPRYTEFEEVLGYRDVMKIPMFQQFRVDNSETETSCNDDSANFQ